MITGVGTYIISTSDDDGLERSTLAQALAAAGVTMTEQMRGDIVDGARQVARATGRIPNRLSLMTPAGLAEYAVDFT